MFLLHLFVSIIVLNSLRCLKREVQETRLPLSDDQVTEEDVKMFKHTQELTTKVNSPLFKQVLDILMICLTCL